MANLNVIFLNILFFTFFLAANAIQGSKTTQVIFPWQQRVSFSPPWELQGSNEGKMKRNSRRLMIGSTAPTCTYNECRGCKYKCRAEQVPIEGNDPINSAYRYKCVCHRP
ncbi:EPIDERMAL PATTERNING FACTOR-like protein 9 [Hibiscus syriacus]|uniref:EPIDERMAL PATTERNING FACTOR-like protein 9 n=1 Tax=Hibiscus syriacus TaxID=106335 RepID=UPI001924FBC6|nr:EPIDERMAL PATTERNING FACTOR-like protein 9 [Hibiscus syriacus]